MKVKLLIIIILFTGFFYGSCRLSKYEDSKQSNESERNDTYAENLCDEMYNCFSNKRTPSEFVFQRGFLLDGESIEISSGNDVVKLITKSSPFFTRKVYFRGEKIDLFRGGVSQHNTFDRETGCGIYIPDLNFYSKKLNKNIHFAYVERFKNFDSLDAFRQCVEADKKYFELKNKNRLGYYNKNGISCEFKIVDDDEYNVLHVSLFITKYLIDWKEINKLPPSPFKPNFKIIEPKE